MPLGDIVMIKSLIVSLVCSAALINSAAAVEQKCGKVVDTGLFLIDYSGSMMEQVQQGNKYLGKNLFAEEFLRKVGQKLKDGNAPKFGIGALAPFTVILKPDVYKNDQLEKAVSDLPKGLEIFGRNTNLGDGLFELSTDSAGSDSNKIAESLSGSTTIFILSDTQDSNRGRNTKEALSGLLQKHPKAKVVFVSFGQPSSYQNNETVRGQFSSVYNGFELLSNENAFSKFLTEELFGDCSFVLSADSLFEFDSFRLTAQGKEHLAETASQIKKIIPYLSAEGGYLSISAHTDRLGSESYNQSLSERRLTTVLKELQKEGVPLRWFKERKALGKSQPITGSSCDNLPRKQQIQCLQPDRRVEIRLIK